MLLIATRPGSAPREAVRQEGGDEAGYHAKDREEDGQRGRPALHVLCWPLDLYDHVILLIHEMTCSNSPTSLAGEVTRSYAQQAGRQGYSQLKVVQRACVDTVENQMSRGLLKKGAECAPGACCW